MQEAEGLLVDGRAQIKGALEAAECQVTFAVRQRWPVTEADGVVVTYEEYSNVSTQCPVVDELVYQVDIWAFDRETVQTVATAVNRAMLGLGLKRVWSGEDAVTDDNSRYLRKAYRFGRRVDKRSMRLVD